MQALTGQQNRGDGVASVISLTGFNITAGTMNATLHSLTTVIRGPVGNSDRLRIVQPSAPTVSSYWATTKPDALASRECGVNSPMTSRLLGRKQLTATPRADVAWYLQQLVVSQSGDGGLLLMGLQGGTGTARIPGHSQGSVHPAWRNANVHAMSYAASSKSTADPSHALASSAEYYEAALEPAWRNWAPDSGAYMNEGNAFSSTWKADFYGPHYDRLYEIKRKYDPTGSLYVWAGVGSDMWKYNLHTGLLCQV